MGPNTNDPKLMRELVKRGMDIARFNFSHGDYEEQKSRMDLLKKIRDEENVPVAILLDTKGPEIRTGMLKDGKKVKLKTGDKFILTTDIVEGSKDKVSISYTGLKDDVEVGNVILIDDGLIGLNVESVTGNDIVCSVTNGGELGEKKGVNIPNVPVRLPAITEKDKDDIRFGVEQGIDFIAASFVRNAECILEIRAYLNELDAPFTPIIAKIENAEGIKNIEEIVRSSDGVMIARGDLGVEIPAEEVPYLQKMIIEKCSENYRPVITATQMLDSMIRNPRPTRAEVTDVATAVYDGTDAVMLSGETAQGKYPIEALDMMVHIVKDTEQHLDYEEFLYKRKDLHMKSISSAIGHASVNTAYNIQAKCLVTPTVSGATARVVSKFKPKTQIYGLSPDERTLRRMQMYWGVYPLRTMEYNSTEEVCSGVLDLVRAKSLVEIGDVVVITAGIPPTRVQARSSTSSNTMRIAVVE